MKIIERLCTKNQCFLVGKPFKPEGLMLHSLGCPQPSAEIMADSFNVYQPNGRQILVHGFIDARNGNTYQTLGWNTRGWHGGGKSNDTHIGIEMCEPACIKYNPKNLSEFTCSDLPAARKNCETTYRSAVELFAYLCKKFKLDPLADGVIISHYEGNIRGIASNHADPEHLWRGLGMPYTMNGFRNDVAAAIGMTEKPETVADKSFYVRVLDPALNIRKSPSLTAPVNGVIRDGGVYTIVETANGSGILWGKLKSDAGWISLGGKYVKKL